MVWILRTKKSSAVNQNIWWFGSYFVIVEHSYLFVYCNGLRIYQMWRWVGQQADQQWHSKEPLALWINFFLILLSQQNEDHKTIKKSIYPFFLQIIYLIRIFQWREISHAFQHSSHTWQRQYSKTAIFRLFESIENEPLLRPGNATTVSTRHLVI